jgi:hypothetical protein
MPHHAEKRNRFESQKTWHVRNWERWRLAGVFGVGDFQVNSPPDGGVPEVAACFLLVCPW